MTRCRELSSVSKTIIVGFVGVLVCWLGFSINVLNNNLNIQTRKTDAIVCQLNAVRNRLFKLDDDVQNVENDIVAMLELSMPYIVTVKKYDSNDVAQVRGAGFIYDATKGYIITAYHMIDNDKPDKKVSKASELIVGINGVDIEVINVYGDAESDFAILIIDINDVMYFNTGQLNIADADARVGETVFAIGHPFRFINSVSKGIVSRTDKNEWFKDYITNSKPVPIMQIDVAVNGGNSGGVLLNIYGDVVGLVTSMWSIKGSGNLGVNFAVPVSEINKCLKRFDKWLVGREFKSQLDESIHNK